MISIVARRILGVVALLMGGALVLWFVYNQFYPTPQYKYSFRSVFQLVVPIAFLVFGWRWLRYEGEGIESTPATLTSPELVESVAEARKTLPYFVAQVETNIDGAYIKYPLVTVQGAKEHIWAYVHSYRDGKFNVSLANVPIDPKESPDGRRDVPLEAVEDWQILRPDGRIKGAYSTMALFKSRQNQGQSLSPKMKKQRALLIDFPD